MMLKKRIISLVLTLVMCLGVAIQADASELNETKEKASQLESKKKAAESEKASLVAQLETIAADMEEMQGKILRLLCCFAYAIAACAMPCSFLP